MDFCRQQVVCSFSALTTKLSWLVLKGAEVTSLTEIASQYTVFVQASCLVGKVAVINCVIRAMAHYILQHAAFSFTFR